MNIYNTRSTGVPTKILDDTQSTKTTDGAFTVEGGIGCARNLNVGDQLKCWSFQDATSTTAASVVTSGGLGVQKRSYFGDYIDLGGNNIMSVATPALADDAATKGYVDSSVQVLTEGDGIDIDGFDVITVDSTVARLTNTQTLTNKTMDYNNNTFTNFPDSAGALKTTGADVTISTSSAPNTDDVLRATSSTAAEWQSLNTLTGNDSGTISGYLDRYQLIDEQEVTSGTKTEITFTGLTGYRFYMLQLDSVYCTIAGRHMLLRFGYGVTPTYLTANYKWHTRRWESNSGTPFSDNNNNANSIRIVSASLSTSVDNPTNMRIFLDRLNHGGGGRNLYGSGNSHETVAVYQIVGGSHNSFAHSSPINAIKLYLDDTGDMRGVYRLYGMKT